MKSMKQEKRICLNDDMVFQFVKDQAIAWQDFLSMHECSKKLAIKMLAVLVTAVCYFVNKKSMDLFLKYFTETLTNALKTAFDNENEKMNEDGTQE